MLEPTAAGVGGSILDSGEWVQDLILGGLRLECCQKLAQAGESLAVCISKRGRFAFERYLSKKGTVGIIREPKIPRHLYLNLSKT